MGERISRAAPDDPRRKQRVGRGTQLVDANELMGQFFRRYSLPAAP